MPQPTPYMSPATRFRVSNNLRDPKLAGAMQIEPNSDAFSTIRLRDGYKPRERPAAKRRRLQV
jgi:hypothetical protein